MADNQASQHKTDHDGTNDKGTFLPLIFGGAVATLIGFFAGQLDAVEQWLGIAQDDGALEQALADQTKLLDAQSQEISAQADLIATLTKRVEELPPPADLSGLEGGLEASSSILDSLAQRIEDVEKRPMTQGLSEEAIAAYEAELERLQGSVEEQRAEIETVLANARATETSAEEQARISLARAAMTRIIAAVDSGAPFADAAADLQSAGGVEIPQALAATSETGVPTLASLQQSFPDAARAALAAARADAAASGENGLGAFLQRRLGARSVTPQEGNDPDAVLSRAEAAVRDGRLGDALVELDALPDLSKATMFDWFNLAETRHGASLAADELIAALSAN